MSEDQKTIKFKYVFDGSYNPKFANGVYGGQNFKGEFVLNFYQERQPIPKTVEYEVKEDGKLGEEVQKDPADHDQIMIRYITTGVTMNYGDAKSFYNWFGNMIKSFEQQAGIPEEYWSK